MGTNSIGWAAVKLNDGGEPCGLLDMGVRIFPDGRNPTDKTSNAVERRTARGQRRRRDRYLKRRGDLMEALIEFGLMPSEEAERKRVECWDPYELRANALDHQLEPFGLGRALFHLGQRRGFKSNRKAGNEVEAEKNKISERIGDLRRDIGESGARTLGEFLWKRHENRETVRARPEWGRYPDRAMYLAEFNAIREKQEPCQKLSPEQWDRLRDEIIFFQRDLKPVVPGWCQFEYENGERRAARALPLFQEFRMLTEVNNLKYRVDNGPEQCLDATQREQALKILRSGKPIELRKGKEDKPAAPPRELGLKGAVFNLARGGRKKIQGDETTAKLSMKAKAEKGKVKAHPGLFGDRWFEFSLEERNGIVRFLLDTDDAEVVKKRGQEEWGLSEAQAQALANVSLPEGYGDLSEKAIGKMLPHLEKGMDYSKAVEAAGYGSHSDFRNDEAHDRLAYYGEVLQRDAVGADPTKDPDPKKDGEVARWGRFPNPTVHIGLNQLRRVVNRLIEVYGKPEGIVVELARDLKMNSEEKRKLEREQREGGQRNERFREKLESAGHRVTADAMRKLRLWEEQGPPQALVCPYTGTVLSFEMVISEQTEVDHILPFSKTLDNSMSNMVVCLRDANRGKGDKSPYEAFGQDILERTDKFPENKKWRFREDAMERFKDEDKFLDRQLNETAYLSRTAKAYLAYLYDERGERRNRVRAAPGRMTALLRRGWGLEELKGKGAGTGKQRDDHRHHAIDAFVLACTGQGLVKKFAQASAFSDGVDERLKAGAKEAQPWEGFQWKEVKEAWDGIVVSYKPDHGTPGLKGQTTGQLHNETAYGLVRLSEDGPSEVVVRKKLRDVKKREELEAVRDEGMRKALLKLWKEVEGEGGEAGTFAEQAAKEGVLLEDGRRQTVRRVRVRVPRLNEQSLVPIKNSTSGKVYKYYERGGNAWADVWEMPDKQKSWKMVVVPTFNANQPDFRIEDSRPHPAAKRRMRLQIDDMGALGEGANRRIVRVRKITNATSGAFVVLDQHNEGNVPDRVGKDMRENRFPAKKLLEECFRKVRVDEIGRVWDPGPPVKKS